MNKLETIKIPGMSAGIKVLDAPMIAVYGPEGSGKTRLGATMPGPIAVIPTDPKTARTLKPLAAKYKREVIAPDKPFITQAEINTYARMDNAKDIEKIKEFYQKVIWDRIAPMLEAIGSHKGVGSILIDNASVLYNWVLYADHGRRTKVPTFERGVSQQDFTDLLALCRSKPTLLTHHPAKVYKNIVENGKEKGVDTGRIKPEGSSKLGLLCNAVIETRSIEWKPTICKREDWDEDGKFKLFVQTCQPRPLLEGCELELTGEDITWNNLVKTLGLGNAAVDDDDDED